MKIICKCGNIEDLKTEIKLVNYDVRNCGDGTLALVCKKCNEIVYVVIKA
jgi:hypothetical protein